jgi:alkanesulfonate monooxygenase SsuD/methylene tetrahydromethanopterin reductase-like flavin-dependent oxidoreductase (luciferase family)
VTVPRLGVTLPQFTGDPARMLEGALRAEALGLDSVWLFDHLWPLGAKYRPILEAWTSLAAVAAATERIGIGTLVTRSSLRHPAVLAKMAATVGAVAPGRLTVALGSGDELSRAENQAYGLPYFSAERRTAQLESALRVVADYLNGVPVARTDDFVAIDGLPPSPRSTRPPKLWIGGWADEVLALAGTHASGWNGWGGSPQRYEHALRTVRASPKSATVEASWGSQALLRTTDASARRAARARGSGRFLAGGPATMASRLADMASAGAQHLILAFPDAGDRGPYELFVREVAPRLADIPPRGIMTT